MLRCRASCLRRCTRRCTGSTSTTPRGPERPYFFQALSAVAGLLVCPGLKIDSFISRPLQAVIPPAIALKMLPTPPPPPLPQGPVKGKGWGKGWPSKSKGAKGPEGQKGPEGKGSPSKGKGPKGPEGQNPGLEGKGPEGHK